jgi:hypothetical protein
MPYVTQSNITREWSELSILKSDIQQNGLLLAIFSGKKERKMLALHFF